MNILFTRHRYSFLALAFVFLGLGLGVKYLVKKNFDLAKYTVQMEQAVHKAGNSINKLFADEDFIKETIKGDITQEKLEELSQHPFTFFLYKKDSILFWSNNNVLPYLTDIESIKGRIDQVSRQKNGIYELIKETYYHHEDTTEYLLIALVPLFYEYPLENDYLKNHFALDPTIPDSVKMSASETEWVVRTLEGKPLFYVEEAETEPPLWAKRLIMLLYILTLIALAIFWNQLAYSIGKRYGFWMSFAFLVIPVGVIRLLSIVFDWLGTFKHLGLLEASYYSNAGQMGALWNLVIDTGLVFWAIIFFAVGYQPRRLSALPKYIRYGLAALIYFTIICSVFGISAIFINLAKNSEISFEFSNIFSLNIYSFVSLFSLTLLLLGLFLLCHRLTWTIWKIKLNITEKLAFLGVALVLFTLLNFGNAFKLSQLLITLFSFGFIVLFDQFMSNKSVSFTWLLIWLIVFSAFSTVLLHNYNSQKEVSTRQLYARKLAEEKDRVTEFRLDEMQEELRRDTFAQSFFKSFFFSRRKFIERIEKQHINSYLFNKYNYSIHTYTENGRPIKGEEEDYARFAEMIKRAKKSEIPHLYSWSAGKEESYYLSDIPIKIDSENVVRILCYFEPKKLRVSKVYPELLLDKRLKSTQEDDRYDYAIYKNGNRIAQDGASYSAKFMFDTPEEQEFSYVQEEEHSHLIYRAEKGKIVVVSKVNGDIVKPISLFSYMFCLQLLVLILMAFANYSFKAIPEKQFGTVFKMKPSLRNRINISVISVIILSFIIIGLVTVFYFRQSTNKYHDQRLGRKVRGVLATVEVSMKNNKDNPYYFPNVSDLSEIHNMDINLYDLDGELVHSSYDEIVEQGLISKRINPNAYFQLKKIGLEQYTQEEKISGLDYLAAYMPLRTFSGDKIAYLGLPYYSKASNLKQDVSEFMGTLLNAYVFLLITAGIVALVIGNSVTRPLQVIGEKLKRVKLGKKNEPLKWDNEDEIGALIGEYNKMIKEMEQSAELLAQSNRESAWREMAKQVAHEIKNPLTPMKLSIQYLERAATANPEDIKDLVKRVSKTLVEQIDNLSTIASSFSNFAKMPQATNEEVNLNALIGSVYDLFSERENMTLSLELPLEEYLVFTDKNHLMRVFNNLIKNAIQAIPEERTGEITISLYRENTMAVVCVKDNGVGIADDKKESVFVPNFTTKSSGTGLGLAISRNIVESAAGKIYFTTEVNVGTQFYVELPIVERNESVEVTDIFGGK